MFQGLGQADLFHMRLAGVLPHMAGTEEEGPRLLGLGGDAVASRSRLWSFLIPFLALFLPVPLYDSGHILRWTSRFCHESISVSGAYSGQALPGGAWYAAGLLGPLPRSRSGRASGCR